MICASLVKDYLNWDANMVLSHGNCQNKVALVDSELWSQLLSLATKSETLFIEKIMRRGTVSFWRIARDVSWEELWQMSDELIELDSGNDNQDRHVMQDFQDPEWDSQ